MAGTAHDCLADVAAGVDEIEAEHTDGWEFLSGPLGGDDMTRIAVLGNNLPRVADMFAVMAADAAGENEMTDVVRVCPPVCLHFRKYALAVYLLHGSNEIPDLFPIRIADIIGREFLFDRCEPCVFRLGILKQRMDGVFLCKGKSGTDAAERDGFIDVFAGRTVYVCRPIVTVDAIHEANARCGEGPQGCRRVPGAVDHDAALVIRYLNPGDCLPRTVRGHIFYARRGIHVPVNPANRSFCGIPSPDAQ